MTNKEKFIVLVDNDIVKKSDAIVLLEGDGFSRIEKTVELYNNNLSSCIVFSGGIINYAYGSYPYSDILPKISDYNIPSVCLFHEDVSRNTYEQAVEIINLSKKNNWKRLILVGSHYHQYRAYLTFLKQILMSNSEIILYNAPAKDLKWFHDEGWGNRFDLLEQEFLKIENYSKLGHLATYEQAIAYQIWKEKQN